MRFTEENLVTAREILSRYPRPKSATIPLLHLAQEQDGYLTEDAMEHIAELVARFEDGEAARRFDQDPRHFASFRGDDVVLHVSGDGAEESLEQLARLIEERFGED